jgi:hypothetical protein
MDEYNYTFREHKPSKDRELGEVCKVTAIDSFVLSRMASGGDISRAHGAANHHGTGVLRLDDYASVLVERA